MTPSPQLTPFFGALLILWGVGLYIQSLNANDSGWHRVLFGLGALGAVAGGLVVGT